MCEKCRAKAHEVIEEKIKEEPVNAEAIRAKYDMQMETNAMFDDACGDKKISLRVRDLMSILPMIEAGIEELKSSFDSGTPPFPVPTDALLAGCDVATRLRKLQETVLDTVDDERKDKLTAEIKKYKGRYFDFTGSDWPRTKDGQKLYKQEENAEIERFLDILRGKTNSNKRPMVPGAEA